MQAKIFDPFSEDALNVWLLAPPAKVIHGAQLFDSSSGGTTRQVALVFYDEERELGASAAPTSPATAPPHPLFDLLDPYFHPERTALPDEAGSGLS